MTNQHYFSEGRVDDVWEKGEIVDGYDSDRFRKDTCGAWMIYDKYGNTKNIFGWEIDHKRPIADGGSDSLRNLQPLQWKNNRQKGDSSIKCNIQAHTKNGKEINVEWVTCPNCNAEGIIENLHLSSARCYSCKNMVSLQAV